MIRLVCSLESEVCAAQDELRDLAAPGMDRNFIHALWEKGTIKANTIQIAGVNSYVILWSIGVDGSFYVNGASSLIVEDRFEDFVSGMETLARAMGCKKIHFHSSRAGVARKFIPAGYDPLSVAYVKHLDKPSTVQSEKLHD